MRREELCHLLPHRGAMLLLDELELLKDGGVQATAHFRGNEWFFSGHFPGNPIVPGVIICEIMAQACCGLLADGAASGRLSLLAKISNAVFHHSVKAGDTMYVVCRLERNSPPFFRASGQAFVDGRQCARAELSFVLQGIQAGNT